MLFVNIKKLNGEVCFAKRYDFGCNFLDREGGNKHIHPELYRLAFLCWPWSQTKEKPPSVSVLVEIHAEV